MNNMIKAIGFCLYYVIGIHLPKSNGNFTIGFAKLFRGICAKLMLSYCGKNVNIEKGASFSTRSTIGDNSGIGIDANCGVVHIGNNVMMGPNCIIITRNHCFDRTDIPMISQGFSSDEPVNIEDDVWIGNRVIILPGVTIHKGSIIGAGAVVTKDVPENSIVGGNPARVIRIRS